MPKVLAGGAGGVGLFAAQHVRSRAWPARPWPGDGQPVQQRAEHWGVPALAGPAQDHQGQAVAVDELMDLGRERSEEHTSELQSRGHLVCRLLLEKKNELAHTPNVPE